MAARANWKGYLRLSLVSCPIALFPATSESEKVRFNQINKSDGQPHSLREGGRRHRRGGGGRGNHQGLPSLKGPLHRNHR